MAISERSTDLWRYVQRRAWEDAASTLGDHIAKTIALPVAPTVAIRADEAGWHSNRFQERAEIAFAGMEKALAKRRFGKAARLRAAWIHTVQLDRLAHARRVAADGGLRLDPMGRGPLAELPAVHYRDRLPWVLRPVAAYEHDNLPDRAASVVETWNTQGPVFDRYMVADEPPGSAPFPTHCLIGAISADGRTGDWFVLDRWAS